MVRALLILALLACWFVPGRADALTPPTCTPIEPRPCDQAQAYAECTSHLDAYIAETNRDRVRARYCSVDNTQKNYVGFFEQDLFNNGNYGVYSAGVHYFRACGNNTQWDQATKTCRDMRCENLPAVPVNPNHEGFTWCQSNTDSSGTYSCEVLGLRQLPTQPFAGYVAGNATGDTCDPNNYACPSGYRKQADGTCQPVPECPDGVPLNVETNECMEPAECPRGKVKNAVGECVGEKNNCPVGQVKGPDDSCVEDENQCPSGQAKGKDGSCKTDADGDGEPDDEADPDKHTAEDSPTCDVAPKCSGDEIMCLHAKQLWRIDCNTRKARNVIMGKYCQEMPKCETVALGDESRNRACDAVEEAALIQQWRTACATSEMLELMKKGGSGTTGGDTGTHSRLDAIKAYLDGNGQQLSNPEVPFEEAPVQSQEWSSGIGGTGTCPAPISTTVTIRGYSASINFGFDPLCQFADYLRYVVLAMAGIMSAFIIAGVRK